MLLIYDMTYEESITSIMRRDVILIFVRRINISFFLFFFFKKIVNVIISERYVVIKELHKSVPFSRQRTHEGRL